MEPTPERAGQFTVAIASDANRHEAILSGEFDIATSDQLTDALKGLAPGVGDRLVIDLSAVTFMDSTGLRVLISANRAATAGSYDLVIVTGDSPAKRVLELTRMDEHMQVVASL